MTTYFIYPAFGHSSGERSFNVAWENGIATNSVPTQEIPSEYQSNRLVGKLVTWARLSLPLWVGEFDSCHGEIRGDIIMWQIRVYKVPGMLF